MTATVHPFTSLVREHRLPCPCRPGLTCYTHRCEDLVDVVVGALERTHEQLLVSAAEMDVVLQHVLQVLEGITGRRVTDVSRPDRCEPMTGERARPRVGTTEKHRKHGQGVGGA